MHSREIVLSLVTFILLLLSMLTVSGDDVEIHLVVEGAGYEIMGLPGYVKLEWEAGSGTWPAGTYSATIDNVIVSAEYDFVLYAEDNVDLNGRLYSDSGPLTNQLGVGYGSPASTSWDASGKLDLYAGTAFVPYEEDLIASVVVDPADPPGNYGKTITIVPTAPMP